MTGTKAVAGKERNDLHLIEADEWYTRMVAAAFFGMIDDRIVAFPGVGGSFESPTPNDPDEVALFEAMLKGEDDIDKLEENEQINDPA